MLIAQKENAELTTLYELAEDNNVQRTTLYLSIS